MIGWNVFKRLTGFVQTLNLPYLFLRITTTWSTRRRGRQSSRSSSSSTTGPSPPSILPRSKSYTRGITCAMALKARHFLRSMIIAHISRHFPSCGACTFTNMYKRHFFGIELLWNYQHIKKILYFISHENFTTQFSR